jgi:hypothetical protein
VNFTLFLFSIFLENGVLHKKSSGVANRTRDGVSLQSKNSVLLSKTSQGRTDDCKKAKDKIAHSERIVIKGVSKVIHPAEKHFIKGRRKVFGKMIFRLQMNLQSLI